MILSRNVILMIVENENKIKYSIRPNLFVLFEKLNFLREYNLLFCLSYKNV